MSTRREGRGHCDVATLWTIMLLPNEFVESIKQTENAIDHLFGENRGYKIVCVLWLQPCKIHQD